MVLVPRTTFKSIGKCGASPVWNGIDWFKQRHLCMKQVYLPASTSTCICPALFSSTYYCTAINFKCLNKSRIRTQKYKCVKVTIVLKSCLLLLSYYFVLEIQYSRQFWWLRSVNLETVIWWSAETVAQAARKLQEPSSGLTWKLWPFEAKQWRDIWTLESIAFPIFSFQRLRRFCCEFSS